MTDNKITNSISTEGKNSKGARKRSMLLIVPALAVAIGIGAVLGASGGKAEVYALDATASVQKGLITVSGNGELRAAPDVAYVQVAVETRAATAKDAQSKNATQFAGLKKVLFEKYKMAAKDVQSTGISVQPEHQYNNKDGTSKIVGYISTHSIRITTRDLEGTGTLLDDLSTAGANRVDGIQFDTEKQDQYELQALEKAMANAKLKAETLAKAAGRQLKGVVNIAQSNVSNGPIPYYGNYAMKSEAAADSAGSTSVQTGEITLSTDVTVVYEME
ncbi:SIMPL domain-containing protein [Paenibacillus oenotherae]|uniref:SIMPL domain-containing protein n=1 Tax=Paenibacillus oenotherae TaxID=1435645 RepID=A0ABS7DCR6_9BACL|nr:SIMPL domain-containing protein [Paenibacillus oenotherae]MBW7477686.1 SIMPL domain-containing protein [Paenibacillus oenotherae]